LIQVLSIGDLEKASGVPRTTIHYYLREGLLPRPQKTAASRSLYTEEHVKILREIAELKQSGLSISEIETELQHRVDQASELTVDLVAQEHERMHNRILAIATKQFASKGYKNTHVTSIMRQLGITATVFYSHFPSKRKLLAECVSVLMKWSLSYADGKTASIEDPAERLLWEVFSHSRVFELGTAAFAVIRVEGTQDDAELRRSIENGLAGTVARIVKELPRPSSSTSKRAVKEELIGLSLLGAWEQTVFNAASRAKYSRKDLLRAHLWLFLAAQAALEGEIDIDSRLGRYEKLISKLATMMPPLPPTLQLEEPDSGRRTRRRE
jgi:DNA-binding transcriptional MerR regulator